MSAEDVIRRLRNVQETVRDGWMADCPACGDDKRSLALLKADDGKLVMHCFQGCERENVAAALEMTADDWWPDPDNEEEAHRQKIPARMVLAGCEHVVTVAMFVCEEVSKQRQASAEQVGKLATAAGRLYRALQVIRGR